MAARILFVHPRKASFILIDRELLAERWTIRDWYQPGRWTNVPALLLALSRTDVVFVWFTSWHAFWPITLGRLLRKPTILVAGGFDTASVPDIGYGFQQGGFRKRASSWLMRRVTRLVTNSFSSRREIERNIGIPPERVTVIHHGVPDVSADVDVTALPREPMALTVGMVVRGNLERKGLRPFVETAAALPDLGFVVAGNWGDDAVDTLRSLASKNVTFTGWISDAELASYYRRASVYVQASRHEGFGLSVAEAMLAGCIPVATTAGALPEVVGDAGVLVERPDARDLAAAIRTALSLPASARLAARRRVLDEFPLEKRRQGLRSVVESVLDGADATKSTG